MKRLSLILLCALLALSRPLGAAGTVTVTSADVDSGNRAHVYRQYTVAWTSTSGGAVSGNPFSVAAGRLTSIRFIPGASTPTNLYDVTLTDGQVVDLLVGQGADCLSASSVLKVWDPPLFQDGTRTLDVVVANAGDTKTGTVVILVEVK